MPFPFWPIMPVAAESVLAPMTSVVDPPRVLDRRNSPSATSGACVVVFNGARQWIGVDDVGDIARPGNLRG